MIGWQSLKRHELSADYDDMTGPEWDSFLEGFAEGGFYDHFPVILHDGKVIDGWQRQRACVQLNIEPAYRTLPDGVDLEAFVKMVNDDRRHESPESKAKHVANRRERVAEMRSKGKSYREIAEEEGVDVKTAYEDAKSGVGGSTPAPTVVGRDGKTYPANKEPVSHPVVAPEKTTTRDDFVKPNTDAKVKVTASKQNFVDAPESDEMTDDADFPIPAKLRAAFSICADMRSVEYRLNRIATDLSNVEQSVAYKLSGSKMQYSSTLITAAHKLRCICPSVVHQDCKGEGCSRCGGKGYLANDEVKGHEDEQG